VVAYTMSAAATASVGADSVAAGLDVEGPHLIRAVLASEAGLWGLSCAAVCSGRQVQRLLAGEVDDDGGGLWDL
jgi:hypothetical protein